MEETKTYTFDEGEAFIYRNKVYYSNIILKNKIEDVFDKLNLLRLKIVGKAHGNEMNDNRFLRCSSCYHSILKNGYRYCNLFGKYIGDDDYGTFCVYHSKKLRTTNKNIIGRLFEFLDEEGQLRKDKILEKISENPNYFFNSFSSKLEKELKV